MNHRFIIGSAPEADLRLAPAADIAARHAELYVENGKVYLKDLDSPGGTYLDNCLRLKIAAVSAQDRVRFGYTQEILLGQAFEWDPSGQMPLRPKDLNDYAEAFKRLAKDFAEYKQKRQALTAGNIGQAIVGGLPYIGGMISKVQQRNMQIEINRLDADIQTKLQCPKCRRSLIAWQTLTAEGFAAQTECPHRCGAKY